MNRIIFLIDLDYFYAQCEQNRKPELKGKPLVICMFSGRTETSGAVATCNYEARALGIHSAQPIFLAKKYANAETTFLQADREYYTEISNQVMQIFAKHADILEQVSIDEAYLDETKKCNENFKKAEELAKQIKKELLQELQLTCSIGVSSNKLVAKIAAGTKKPDGLTTIKPEEIRAFLNPLKVEKLHGVGEVTTKKLNSLEVFTVQELSKFPVHNLVQVFGENKAKLLHEKSLGIDDSLVEETKEKQQLNTIGTLKADSNSFEEIDSQLRDFSRKLIDRVHEKNIFFKTVSIILITTKLETLTRSKTLEKETNELNELIKVSESLLKDFLAQNPEIKLRRFGVRVGNFVEQTKQKSLFEFGN
ncbi:MAG: DNA polymerase IV [archaeon]|nr:DNA polymerase IV [archaeon]